MSKNSKAKKIKAFGILNAFGDFWTTKTFQDEAEAEDYKELFWSKIENPPDMSKHKVVPVEITLLK